MNPLVTRILFVCFLFLYIEASGYQVTSSELFHVDLRLPEAGYRKIKKGQPKRLEFEQAVITINDRVLPVKSIHTRGKTSQLQRRKSFTVELDEHISVPFSQGTLELDAFYLISMSLDANYFRNRLSYGCLSELGVFPLMYRYVYLTINDEHEGIYMLVQRPFDCMIDQLDSPYALRRVKSGTIDKDKHARSTTEDDVESYRQQFKQIVRTARDLEGEELYLFLCEQLDMRSYFRWLAYNYLVRNGDYSDEIYYYIESKEVSRFKVIGWDYDDIFMKGPHEGKEIRDKVLGDKILFSSEDALDRIIADDPYVYGEYLAQVEIIDHSI